LQLFADEYQIYNSSVLKLNEMKHHIFLIAITLLITGCANLDYAKNLKPEELLYQTEVANSGGEKTHSQEEIVNLYMKVGADKEGYVGSYASEQRKMWDTKYPILVHDDKALDKLMGFNYRTRLGQALIFAADIEPQTSGFLKDSKGKPISVSGRFEPDANAAMTQGLTSGVVVGATSGVMAVNSINSQLAPSGWKLTNAGANSVAGAQMAQGLVAGLIAGAIHASMAETAMKEILTAKNFGERMTATTTTAAHMLPGLRALGPDGLIKSAKPVVVAPGVVKSYYMSAGEKAIDYKTTFHLFTVVSTYRGKPFEDDFPNTGGWDSIISNMASIRLNADEINDAEKSFIGIKREAINRKLF
jgi:hypothetical protein